MSNINWHQGRPLVRIVKAQIIFTDCDKFYWAEVSHSISIDKIIDDFVKGYDYGEDEGEIRAVLSDDEDEIEITFVKNKVLSCHRYR